jgi:hypothetical protein
MRIVKQIHWPDIARPVSLKNMAGAVYQLFDILDRLRRTIDNRDKKIAQAINAADIQVVTSSPSDPPEAGEPTLQVYYSGATYRLYVYVDGAWRYVALT